MKSFTKHYFIAAPKQKVWDALTKPDEIQKWLGEKVVMEATVNGKFSLWQGSIWGRNLEIVENEKLTQEWYGCKWPAPSLVTFYLFENEGRVEVKLTHENLPDEEAASFDNGWDEFYMGPLKEFCEKE